MTAPAPQQLIYAALWVAPGVQTLASLGLAWFAMTVRRNFGAHSSSAVLVVVATGVFLALHVGYFMAPVWWKSGRHLLGAATMLPIALVVLGSMVAVVGQTDILSDVARWGMGARVLTLGGALVLALAYVVPLMVMLFGR